MILTSPVRLPPGSTGAIPKFRYDTWPNNSVFRVPKCPQPDAPARGVAQDIARNSPGLGTDHGPGPVTDRRPAEPRSRQGSKPTTPRSRAVVEEPRTKSDVATAPIDLNLVAAGIAEIPVSSANTSIKERVDHVQAQGRTDDLNTSRSGSAAGSAAATGLEESHWLCPIEYRHRLDCVQEGMVEGFCGRATGPQVWCSSATVPMLDGITSMLYGITWRR